MKKLFLLVIFLFPLLVFGQKDTVRVAKGVVRLDQNGRVIAAWIDTTDSGVDSVVAWSIETPPYMKAIQSGAWTVLVDSAVQRVIQNAMVQAKQSGTWRIFIDSTGGIFTRQWPQDTLKVKPFSDTSKSAIGVKVENKLLIDTTGFGARDRIRISDSVTVRVDGKVYPDTTGFGARDRIAVSGMPANVIGRGSLDAIEDTVSIILPAGCGTVGVYIKGTWSGQLNFEGTVNDTNYEAIEASNGTQSVNAVTTNDNYILPGAGYSKLRVRAAAWTSGTANVTFNASIGAAANILTGALPAGSNTIGTVLAKADSLFTGAIDSVFQDTLKGSSNYIGTLYTTKNDSMRLWTPTTDTSSTTSRYIELIDYTISTGDSTTGFDLYAYCNTNSTRINIGKGLRIVGNAFITHCFIPPQRLPAKYLLYGRKYVNGLLNSNNKDAHVLVTIRYRYR